MKKDNLQQQKPAILKIMTFALLCTASLSEGHSSTLDHVEEDIFMRIQAINSLKEEKNSLRNMALGQQAQSAGKKVSKGAHFMKEAAPYVGGAVGILAPEAAVPIGIAYKGTQYGLHAAGRALSVIGRKIERSNAQNLSQRSYILGKMSESARNQEIKRVSVEAICILEIQLEVLKIKQTDFWNKKKTESLIEEKTWKRSAHRDILKALGAQ